MTSWKSPPHGLPWSCVTSLNFPSPPGARLAEPGEFTMRAFLNGRLDLTQAEAVRDLIDSQTMFSSESRGAAKWRAHSPIG